MAFKKGEANPRKKKVEESTTNTGLDPNKLYEFELIQTYERYKGKAEDGKPVGLPYPPVKGYPNEGVYFDEETKQKRRFRFVNGLDSIWVDEQEIDPTPLEMADGQNQIEFINGKLRVRGIDQTKLAALLNSDYYEGKKVRNKEVVPEFRLLNPDKEVEDSMAEMDVSYKAEQAARDANTEQMMAFADTLGINLERKETFIRRDFILAAKANPSYFLKHFVNPRNKYAYAFKEALADNHISATKVPNQLVWSGTDVVICPVNTNGDVAGELANKAIEGDESVLKLFAELEKL